VGAGAGASAGGLKGGVGTASVTLDDDITVGAIVVVNAAGSTVDQRDCSLLGASLAVGDEFAGLRPPKRSECRPPKTDPPSSNTTIAVVATDAALEKGAAGKMASVAHDGVARAINQVHSLVDGDTVFGLSTGTGSKLGDDDPSATEQLDAIFGAASNVLSRAVAHAMLSASSTESTKSYCDTYPSACADLDRSEGGKAPEVRTESTVEGLSRRMITALRGIT
jgi:L-aminopeptidase/D-esterase-like protein